MFINNNNNNKLIIFLDCTDLDASCTECDIDGLVCRNCGIGNYWSAGTQVCGGNR